MTTDDSPRARAPSALTRVGIILFVLFVFAALGPPVGALVFLGLLAAMIGGQDFAGGLMVFLFTAIFGVPLSYMVGFGPAVLTGAVFALWQAFRGPISFAWAGLVGVGAGVVLAATMPDAVGRGNQQLPLAGIILTCVVPTVVCWLIVRSFAIRPPPR